jgi:hypothetical protein
MSQLRRRQCVSSWAASLSLSLCSGFACDDDDASTLREPTRLTSGAIDLGPELPPDVDTAEQARLTGEGRYPSVQRLFDELSWQSFIALNWPQAGSGQPAARLTDEGTLVWETYSESYEVFKPDGSTPDPYGAPRQTLPAITDAGLPNAGTDVLPAQQHRVLHNISAVDSLNVVDEVNQAFSSPLWDQYGNLVHYEVLLNQPEYDYIAQNELYNLQGQVAFAAANGGVVQLPAGRFGTSDLGAIEVKLAWRVLTPDDIPARYLVRKAFIVVEEPVRWQEVSVGLVGMHISHKTVSSPQWIWSTFEHVDNLDVDSFAAFGPDAVEHPKRASFYDPDCEYCPVNVVPKADAEGKLKTQVSRAVPIPKATQAFNAEVQALLRAADSPLQYYELINTQWPTEPTAPPAATYAFPENITNKSGGRPTPVYLINTTMETYFQSGASRSGGSTTDDVSLVVGTNPPVSIPSTNGGNTPLRYAEGYCDSLKPPGDCREAANELVFSTESCMGCHSSATISVTGSGTNPSDYQAGDQLSGDFSWLFSQKAAVRTD